MQLPGKTPMVTMISALFLTCRSPALPWIYSIGSLKKTVRMHPVLMLPPPVLRGFGPWGVTSPA